MNLNNFRKYAGPVIAKRAAEYLAEGRVNLDTDLTNEDAGVYQYKVRGTSNYNVLVKIDDDEITSASCTCPYTYYGYCKHITAALMDIKERRDNGKKTVLPETEADVPKNELGLTENETFILCYIACTGTDSYNLYLKKLPKGLAPSEGYTQTVFEAYKKLLRKSMWLRAGERISPVNQTKILFVLVCLIRFHKEWLDFFEKRFNQPDYVQYLIDVARVLCDEKVQKVRFYKATYYYGEDATVYIQTAIMSILPFATPEQIGVFMDDDQLCRMADALLLSVLEYDYVSELKYVETLLSKVRHASAKSAELYCQYRLAVFYARAEELPLRGSSANYCPTYYLDAAKALLNGNAADAIALFQQGIKIQSKNSSSKNIPDDSISFFLYVTALSTRRSKKDVSTLSAILKKRHDIHQYKHSFIFPLVAFSQSSDQNKEYEFIDRVQSHYIDNYVDTETTIAVLTACFFGMKDRWTKKFPDPNLGILRNECKYYFGDALQEASVSWPYEAVLPRIPVRQAWELQIEELLHQVQVDNPAKTAKTDENRLYYIANDPRSRHIEVREQGKLASGAWSKGKKLSFVRYKAGDCPMDDIDKLIHAEWLKGDPALDRRFYQTDFPSFELILPYLVGTDKLAISSGRWICPATVNEQKPFIWTEKRDGEIWFGSNIPSAAYEYTSMFMQSVSATEFVVYPMPGDLIPAYKRIMSIGHVPAQAETLLGQLFEALRGRLEVHSDIAGGISLPKVDGNPAVIVRITPDMDYFYLSAIVRPLDGGSAEFFPGKGDAIIYDSAEGNRTEVLRNLKKETSNLKKVNALMPEDRTLSDGGILDASELLEFMESVASMPSAAVLEWPEGESVKLFSPKTSKWEINTVGKGGWYELEGELAVSDDKVLSVQELLSLLRESKGRYIRIGEKEFMQLSDGIRRQLERIGYASQEYHGKARIPALALAVMGGELSGEIAIEEPDALLEMRERIRRSRNMTYEVPAELNATLRYYQEEGYQWLMRVTSWGAGACLADDMGLGKTVQAIAFMLSHVQDGPSLVVAPASVVANWQRELERFAPTMHPHFLSGMSSDTRASVLESLASGDVLILTYGLLASEAERLSVIKWNVVCLDEAHTIKNRDTKTSAAAMRLDAAHRLILTGTPVQNHLGELWNLFRFINPGLLGTYEQFSKKYMSDVTGSTMELKRLVAPFLLRRTKQEVVRELPDKEEIVVPVTLSENESAVYEVIRREAVSEVSGASTLSVNALSMITKLRMAACSAQLAEKKWVGTECSKIDAFLDKLLPIIEGGNSVLVFSQFTSFLSMAVEALEKAGVKDYLYLDGQTPVSKRQKLVDSFQKGEYKVFFISLKAGGLGLNLTGANYVIHLDPWWNPAIEQQATDRAYRIGQSQKVTVYHLISSQTIEEKILRLHATKRTLADSILEGTDKTSRLTPEELLAMLI